MCSVDEKLSGHTVPPVTNSLIEHLEIGRILLNLSMDLMCSGLSMGCACLHIRLIKHDYLASLPYLLHSHIIEKASDILMFVVEYRFLRTGGYDCRRADHVQRGRLGWDNLSSERQAQHGSWLFSEQKKMVIWHQFQTPPGHSSSVLSQDRNGRGRHRADEASCAKTWVPRASWR